MIIVELGDFVIDLPFLMHRVVFHFFQSRHCLVTTEKKIDRLEGEALRFGVEKVDHRDERCVDDGEHLKSARSADIAYNVKFVANVFDTNRSHLDDGVVGDPVASSGDGGTLLTQTKGKDFGRIHPNNSLESDLISVR